MLQLRNVTQVPDVSFLFLLSPGVFFVFLSSRSDLTPFSLLDAKSQSFRPRVDAMEDSSIPPVFIHIFFLSFFSVTRNRRGRKIKKKKIKKKKNSAPGIFVSVFGSFFFFFLLSFPSKHNYSSGFEQNIHLSARVSDDDPPRAALLFFFLSPFF